MTVHDCIVTTTKKWNRVVFQAYTSELKGRWPLVSHHLKLTPFVEGGLEPKYILFPHWSWTVPAELFEQYECVCFHMTDVPFGRGGNPLQNIIVRGIKQAKLTALRIVEKMAAGLVYEQQPLELSGRAQDIFERAVDAIYQKIRSIIDNDPRPRTQEGESEVFLRRTPEQSILPNSGSIEQLYDHIRMLDVETYPRTFLANGTWRLELRSARLEGDEIVAEVCIMPVMQR